MDVGNPDDWPSLEILPSMATLNMPEDHKTPMKGAYKPDSKSGKLLYMSRTTTDTSDTFNTAISAIGVNAKEGMKYMADAMILKSLNIQPKVVFNFFRTASDNLYSKDVLANILDDAMGEIVRLAYTSDILGVFVLQRQRKRTSMTKLR